MASVFTDYFMEDFTQFIKMKHSQTQSKNIQADLLFYTLPYLLNKILPLLPKQFRLQFTGIAYLYFNAALGIGSPENILLLQAGF